MSEQWSEDRGTTSRWADADGLGHDDVSAVAYPPEGLVTLRFLWDAVWRHTRLWLVTAVVGLAVGAAVPLVLPPPAVATTQLLLTHREGDDPAQAMATDVKLATTRTVAERVVSRMRSRQTPDRLLKQYTASAVTDRILEISASARSNAEATRLATTVATTFLEFRMEQVRAQRRPAQRKLAAAEARLARLQLSEPGRGTGENGDAETSDPSPALEKARQLVTQLEQTVDEQSTATTQMTSSRTLDAASPVHKSPLKTLALDTASGLAAGLVVGVGFVVARALLSDRLWRRQAIAHALGVRIAVSLGRLGGDERWQRLRERVHPSNARREDLELAVRRLRAEVRWPAASKPTLTIVAVDDLRVSALVLTSLATSFAERGTRVLVADLSRAGTLARSLGVEAPGTESVPAGESTLIVYQPEAGVGPPEGGLLASRDVEGTPGREAMWAAWDDADLVLTLTDLYPALGGDHLRSWSTHAVAVVTAGRSTATRLQSTAELVRLAGVQLDCAVLVGHDRTDETVGLPTGADEDESERRGVEMVGR